MVSGPPIRWRRSLCTPSRRRRANRRKPHRRICVYGGYGRQVPRSLNCYTGTSEGGLLMSRAALVFLVLAAAALPWQLRAQDAPAGDPAGQPAPAAPAAAPERDVAGKEVPTHKDRK